MVFISFIHNEKIIEYFFLIALLAFEHPQTDDKQFLYSQEMLMRTTGEDILKILDSFMEEDILLCSKCEGICTDGAPSMVGSIKGFTALAKKENEKIIFTHCFLHRKNLVAKTIENDLKEVRDQVV